MNMDTIEISKTHEATLDPPTDSNKIAIAPTPDEDAEAFEVRMQGRKKPPNSGASRTMPGRSMARCEVYQAYVHRKNGLRCLRRPVMT
jgi:hypothetical protein